MAEIACRSSRVKVMPRSVRQHHRSGFDQPIEGLVCTVARQISNRFRHEAFKCLCLLLVGCHCRSHFSRAVADSAHFGTAPRSGATLSDSAGRPAESGMRRQP